METCARGWGSFPCAWPAVHPPTPRPSEPARKREAGPKDTRGRGPADPQGPRRWAFRCRTGANPQGGVGEGETPTSLVPRTVVRPLIHSQNRSRKGGREERLEEERMEEEWEEGSVGRGLQEPPPGSLEILQPSAGLPAPDAAPARRGKPVGVRRARQAAPLEPGAAPARRGAARPSGVAGWPGPRSPCRRLPALRYSAGPRRLHAPPPAPRRRRASLPGAPPPLRAPTDERRPHGAAFKYRARTRRERRPPPAPGPGKLERVGGLPQRAARSTPFLAQSERATRGRCSAGRGVPRARGSRFGLCALVRWVPPRQPEAELLRARLRTSCPGGGGHCAQPRT